MRKWRILEKFFASTAPEDEVLLVLLLLVLIGLGLIVVVTALLRLR